MSRRNATAPKTARPRHFGRINRIQTESRAVICYFFSSFVSAIAKAHVMYSISNETITYTYFTHVHVMLLMCKKTDEGSFFFLRVFYVIVFFFYYLLLFHSTRNTRTGLLQYGYARAYDTQVRVHLCTYECT